MAIAPADSFALAIIAQRPKSRASQDLAKELKGRARQMADTMIEASSTDPKPFGHGIGAGYKK
jgi:hypothetical protein